MTNWKALTFVQASEFQPRDELYVPGAAVAEIWIELIRRIGQAEPRAESR